MKKRQTARSVFKVFSLILFFSLLAANLYTQETPAVHAQDAYTATPTSIPVVENTPESPDQPDAATTETGSIQNGDSSSSVVEEPAESIPTETENLPQDQVDEPGIPTDRIIVKYKSETDAFSTFEQASEMERASSAAGMNLNYLRAMSGDSHVLQLSERLPLEQVQAISEQLMLLPEVEYAEPDAILMPMLTPNDPRYGSQWHYFGPWGINAPAAWDITTGSSTIVMAVLDTGITNHVDLRGRTVPGYDFITNLTVANDGNGRDANASDPGDWAAAGECGPGSSARTSSWHGTHVAGTMGAASNNGIGVAGVNWNSKILPVRVLGKCGGYTSDIADGMRWAAGLSVSGVPKNPNPAKVLNLSLGGYGACGTTSQNAINSVTSAGSVIVIAAGNSNANAANYSPGNCNGVITVAATRGNGYRASYSNYGSSVEISAPGGDMYFDTGVLSTLNTGTAGPAADSYVAQQGTSMAAPHVSGVVSLMFSLNPNLKPAQVLQILRSTAKPFPSGGSCSTSNCGAGVVNAGAAVNAVPPAITGFSPQTGEEGTSVTISGANFSRVTDVRFNGVSASFSIVSGTSITATVPEGATSGPITVTHPGGTATSGSAFVVAVLPRSFGKSGPANGASVPSTSLTLSWEASVGASSYAYCYDTTNDNACLSWTSTGTSTSKALSGLSPAVTYYWHVRAFNASGTTYSNGSSTAFWSFTTPMNPPGAFKKLIPANGVINQSRNPRLGWGSSAGATSYEYCYDTTNDDVCSNWTNNGIATTVNLNGLDYDAQYYWHVRAVNSSAITYSNSSNAAFWRFTTQKPAIPGIPVLRSPANAALVASLRPALDWNDSSPIADLYQLQVATNNTFTSLIVDDAHVLTSTFTPAAEFVPGTRYYWRVKAFNAIGGASAWSPMRTFKTSLSQPVLVSPQDVESILTHRPTFKWDAAQGASQYTLQVSTSSNFKTLLLNTSVNVTEYIMTKDLPKNKTLYWRVRARSATLTGPWSARWAFKTPLAQPALVSPSSGEALTSDRPVFLWDDVPLATSYTLQVSAQSTFRTLLVNTTVKVTEYTATKDLPQNKTLYWRVRAKSSTLTGPWTAKSSFRTGNPATVPMLASPANNALVKDYTPRLNWNDSKVPRRTTFKYYELQVDVDHDFSSPVIETTTTVSEFIPLSDLTSNTKFYWRVRAVNQVNGVEHTSGWSAARSFRTVVLPPTGLTMIPNGLQPSFSWDAGTGQGVISGYTIQISTNSSFSTLLVNSTTPNAWYAMSKNLPAHRTIYWRVRVNGTNGPSAWTTTQFTTP